MTTATSPHATAIDAAVHALPERPSILRVTATSSTDAGPIDVALVTWDPLCWSDIGAGPAAVSLADDGSVGHVTLLAAALAEDTSPADGLAEFLASVSREHGPGDDPVDIALTGADPDWSPIDADVIADLIGRRAGGAVADEQAAADSCTVCAGAELPEPGGDDAELYGLCADHLRQVASSYLMEVDERAAVGEDEAETDPLLLLRESVRRLDGPHIPPLLAIEALEAVHSWIDWVVEKMENPTDTTDFDAESLDAEIATVEALCTVVEVHVGPDGTLDAGLLNDLAGEIGLDPGDGLVTIDDWLASLPLRLAHSKMPDDADEIDERIRAATGIAATYTDAELASTFAATGEFDRALRRLDRLGDAEDVGEPETLLALGEAWAQLAGSDDPDPSRLSASEGFLRRAIDMIRAEDDVDLGFIELEAWSVLAHVLAFDESRKADTKAAEHHVEKLSKRREKLIERHGTHDHVHGPDCDHDHGDAPVREPASSGEKVARNAPCPCGSGAKYKRCCGA